MPSDVTRMSKDRRQLLQKSILCSPNMIQRALNIGKILAVYSPIGIGSHSNLVDIIAGISKQRSNLFQLRQLQFDDLPVYGHFSQICAHIIRSENRHFFFNGCFLALRNIQQNRNWPRSFFRHSSGSDSFFAARGPGLAGCFSLSSAEGFLTP